MTRSSPLGFNPCISKGSRQHFSIVRETFYWDGEAQVFVGRCELSCEDHHASAWVHGHSVWSQGTTLAGARTALDSAVTLTIKHWPPRDEPEHAPEAE